MYEEQILQPHVTTHPVQRSATYPPRFPIPTTMAGTTPRFISPPGFPPTQAVLTGMVENTQKVVMIAATEPGPGLLVTQATMYPIMETAAPSTTNGPRKFTLSE